MENLSMRQVINVNSKKGYFINFVKNNGIKILIGGISISLLIIYFILMCQFINLIKIIKL